MAFLPYASASAPAGWSPPAPDVFPPGPLGEAVRYGHELVVHTDRYKERFHINGLTCQSCHLEAGRKAGAIPLWGAWGVYPRFREASGHVDRMTERIQACFRFSMNGVPPPPQSPEMVALESYAFWLARGLTIGEDPPGRRFRELAQPRHTPDPSRGKSIYQTSCARCHGQDGQELYSDQHYVFPPLWGMNSYNFGASMHQLDVAAAFVLANMNQERGNQLGEQDAWDVAAFMNSHQRPQDPGFVQDVAHTKAQRHSKHMCFYGTSQDGHLLGHDVPAAPSPLPTGRSDRF
jgi:thiosulfate dehydrogenase